MVRLLSIFQYGFHHWNPWSIPRCLKQPEITMIWNISHASFEPMTYLWSKTWGAHPVPISLSLSLCLCLCRSLTCSLFLSLSLLYLCCHVVHLKSNLVFLFGIIFRTLLKNLVVPLHGIMLFFSHHMRYLINLRHFFTACLTKFNSSTYWRDRGSPSI